MEIIKVNKENFEKEVLKSKKNILIDFNADWCGPCRMLSPILDEIAKENNKAKIVSVNIDDEEELADEYNISSIPCLVLIKEGKEINRSVGLKPKEEIEKMIGE